MARIDVNKSRNSSPASSARMSNTASRRVKRGLTAVEKRKGELPVPLNLKSFLSTQQMDSAQQMESFGWHIAFVRRAQMESPLVVVANRSERRIGLLERDGSINTSCDLVVRP